MRRMLNDDDVILYYALNKDIEYVYQNYINEKFTFDDEKYEEIFLILHEQKKYIDMSKASEIIAGNYKKSSKILKGALTTCKMLEVRKELSDILDTGISEGLSKEDVIEYMKLVTNMQLNDLEKEKDND